MMSDNISRQAAIEEIQPFGEYESNRTNKEWVRLFTIILKQLPSADCYGEWKEVGSFEDEIGVKTYVLWCQNCGALHRVRKLWTGEYVNAEYCPHCGADMRGEKNED